MKLNARTIAKTDDAFGRALDFALATLLFVGLGWLVDRWLGTTPLFMIVLVTVGLVGQFLRLWYTYDASMRQHEAERAAQRAGNRAAAEASTEQSASQPEVGV